MIDLHMHTVYSDGSKTVEEILKMCEERKLEYISITDHNNCEAYYDEILKNNKIFNGKIIKGCELNAQFKDMAIEILAYNINPDIIMEWKEKYYSPECRKKNNAQIYDRFLKILDKKRVIYNKNNIRPLRNDKELVERTIWEEIIKHPENKEIIGEENFNSLRAFYRTDITNPNSEYFLNRAGTFPSVSEVIDIIHKAGGLAFLAHPFEYKFEDTFEYIDTLLSKVNLDGIECFHPSASKEERTLLVNYAKNNDLYISGGSDYHGMSKPDIDIGVGKGDLNIPKEYIEQWIDK